MSHHRHAAVSDRGTAGVLPSKQTHEADLSGTGTHDIVMEQARSECDANRFKAALKKFLDSMHMRPQSKRMQLSTLALKELNECLNLTEIMTMVPPHVTGLTMCCPPSMRLVPWNTIKSDQYPFSSVSFKFFIPDVYLIYFINLPIYRESYPHKHIHTFLYIRFFISVDVPGPEGVLVEAPLAERYTVKLGPSLTLMEINSMAAMKLNHAWGLHR